MRSPTQRIWFKEQYHKLLDHSKAYRQSYEQFKLHDKKLGDDARHLRIYNRFCEVFQHAWGFLPWPPELRKKPRLDFPTCTWEFERRYSLPRYLIWISRETMGQDVEEEFRRVRREWRGLKTENLGGYRKVYRATKARRARAYAFWDKKKGCYAIAVYANVRAVRPVLDVFDDLKKRSRGFFSPKKRMPRMRKTYVNKFKVFDLARGRKKLSLATIAWRSRQYRNLPGRRRRTDLASKGIADVKKLVRLIENEARARAGTDWNLLVPTHSDREGVSR